MVSSFAPPTLAGAAPGVLDAAQRARLLPHGGHLLFAAFHPQAASAARANAPEPLTRPKRVVLELSPNGAPLWRYVPRARLAPGVLDEGAWPRAVDLCGWIYAFSSMASS
jgi:hypothetical protein